MLKKLSITTLCILLFFALSIESFAECRSWYIKRNGTNPPTPPKDIDMIKAYNGFYLDEGLSDGEKKLYLTFDAGYENGNIERILDVLKTEQIPAAFFVLDHLILENTDLVIRMTDEGHLVCNHTKRHKNLSNSDKEEIADDLSALEKIYRDKTKKEMTKYFRFPEGKYSESAMRCVSELGYKTIFWSFAYEDWDNSKQPSKEYALNKILSNTHNGAVILLHPTSKTNADILPELISKWREMGYEFGTLDELTNKKGS